jgi:aminopeptidase YwaD
MNLKVSNVKATSCLLIIGLLASTLTSIASASATQQSLCIQQSCTSNILQNSSAVVLSSDILEMIQQVNATLLQTYIQKIQDFGPHPTGSKACEMLGKYLYETLNSFHLSVRYDPWKYKLRSGRNIEATLQGTANSDCIVIVSAHYDSVIVSPGADDDGSGVAVVLAVADIMSNYCFNSTVRFVLFSGEEQGLLGSHEYVQQAYRTGEHILADLQLDGVGHAVTSDDGNKIKHHSNNQSAWMVDISTAIASYYYNEIDLEVVRLPHVTFSDHESFVKYDYDASYFFEYVLTPYYHTSEDTLEHMNITYLAKVCKLTVGTLATIAEFHPRLSNGDIAITIKGQALAHPCQFYVRIENEKPRVDTANVTINVALKNLRTGQYILMMNGDYNLSCNWTFTKEIKTDWEFKTMSRQYSPQLVFLEVTVRGIKDDVTLYVTQRSVGIVIGWFVFLFPK